jgi:pimeloyl-ACP methyl ester carboxylesterase
MLLSSLAAAAPVAAQQLPCNSDTIHVATKTGLLAGSVMCPSTPAPWPAVLIIAGSGPTDRNGNSPLLPGQNNSLKMLAEALASRGIASVRYDKRGIAASAGLMKNEADLRFDMLADDAADWVRLMRGDSRFKTITVAGHSEGSLLGMIATQRANADAYVSIAGVGRKASTVLHEQLAPRVPMYMAAVDSAFALLDAGKLAENTPPALASIFRPSVQPYLISWFKYDPSVEIKKLSVPVLITQGSTDIQVAVLDARLLAAADPKATLVIVDGMNHVLKLVPDDQAKQMQSYGDPSLPVAPKLVDAIAGFVLGVKRR